MNSPQAEPHRRTKGWLVALSIGGVCVAIAVWLVLSWEHITSKRTVVHVTTPNGVELKIEQTWTASFDLFYTSFFYRQVGGPWKWRYYSHEDGYWGKGRVESDPASHTATIYRGGKPTIKFNWDSLVHTQFTETQDGKPRTFTPASDL